MYNLTKNAEEKKRKKERKKERKEKKRKEKDSSVPLLGVSTGNSYIRIHGLCSCEKEKLINLSRG